MNLYKEIKEASQGFYKEKGSKFISYIFPVYSKNEITKNLKKIKRTENSANHYCYAYILNYDQSNYKAYDDGEPSSTAGRPILGQIRSNKLTNTLIIVVRYFGGKKLGSSGLIRSYKNAALNAIQNSLIITKKIKNFYKISFNYNDTNIVMSLIKKNKLEIINSELGISSNIIFAVSKDNEHIINNFINIHSCTIKYLKTE